MWYVAAWPVCVQILCVMGLLVRIMHFLPSLAGLGVTMLLIPTSMVLGKRLGASRRAQIKHTDARVKLCSEVITGEAQREAHAPPSPCPLDPSLQHSMQALRLTASHAARPELNVPPLAIKRRRGEGGGAAQSPQEHPFRGVQQMPQLCVCTFTASLHRCM